MVFWLYGVGIVVTIIVVALIFYHNGHRAGYCDGKAMGERDAFNSLWKQENTLPIGKPLLCLGSVKTEIGYLSCIYLGREIAKASPLEGNYVFVMATHPFPRLFQLGVKEDPGVTCVAEKISLQASRIREAPTQASRIREAPIKDE